MEKIELLAPAGNLNILKAAVDNGADAIYLGGENFSARAFADNFTNEEIVEGIKYAHVRGAKVYVSINTLVYDDEINDVFNFADFSITQGTFPGPTPNAGFPHEYADFTIPVPPVASIKSTPG